MQEDKDVLRKCEVCGEAKLVQRGDQHVFRRCKCDWKRGFHDRIAKTIHPDFWYHSTKTIKDWSPSIFRPDNAGAFKNFIMLQKIQAMHAIYDFCFKEVSMDQKTDAKRHALQSSIENSKNLFIRGPQGSGRGLLVASIKTMCAIKDISTTPYNDDFALFRTLALKSLGYGKDGEEAQIELANNFTNAQVLTLMDVRGDRKFSFKKEEWINERSRMADVFDSILAIRASKPGAAVFASPEFGGEISATLGDKFYDILQSEKTSLILLFKPEEADELLDSLITQANAYIDAIQFFSEEKTNNKKEGKTTAKARGQEQMTLAQIKEGFYFAEAFPSLPASKTQGAEVDLQVSVAAKDGQPDDIRKAYAEFLEDKQKHGMNYRENVKRAITNAVLGCKLMAEKMTPKEIEKTGNMLSEATTKSEGEIMEARAAAIALRKEMAGIRDDEKAKDERD